MVHNHGTEDGPGLACRESIVDGKLRGACLGPVTRSSRPSRIFFVADDDRERPAGVCWWRLTLRRDWVNEHGHALVQNITVGDPAGGDVWAGHVDYFDGAAAWSWPFGTRHSVDRRDAYGGDIVSMVVQLDVLDVVPPLGRGWRKLSDGAVHPDDVATYAYEFAVTAGAPL